MSKITEEQRRNLEALAAKQESDIDFSDIPPTVESDWVVAERGRFLSATQTTVERKSKGRLTRYKKRDDQS